MTELVLRLPTPITDDVVYSDDESGGGADRWTDVALLACLAEYDHKTDEVRSHSLGPLRR